MHGRTWLLVTLGMIRVDHFIWGRSADVADFRQQDMSRVAHRSEAHLLRWWRLRSYSYLVCVDHTMVLVWQIAGPGSVLTTHGAEAAWWQNAGSYPGLCCPYYLEQTESTQETAGFAGLLSS